jgi:hypothetical protein
VTCLNPGFVDTDIRKEWGWINWVIKILGYSLFWWFTMTPEQGAAAPLYLALSPEVEGVTGALFDHKKKNLGVSDFVKNQENRDKLWKRSCELANYKE